MNGVIVGGWGYVIAAYSLTAVGFALYGVRLWLRLREEKRLAHD